MSDKIRRAINILRRRYRSLAEEIAQDILDHAEEFESSPYTQADSIIDHHSRRLGQLGRVLDYLQRSVPRQKPAATKPLGKDEFRCFGCGEVFRQDDQICRTCGWTWH